MQTNSWIKICLDKILNVKNVNKQLIIINKQLTKVKKQLINVHKQLNYDSFLEKIGNVDNGEIPCQAWTTRMPKYAQADLNYTAPEIQHKSVCSSASDMFSFGLLMVSVFNGGQSLIQANYSTNLYFKQAGVVRRFFWCPTQCLKITENVSFNIASEASYVYKSSSKNAKNRQFWRVFFLKIWNLRSKSVTRQVKNNILSRQKFIKKCQK